MGGTVVQMTKGLHNEHLSRRQRAPWNETHLPREPLRQKRLRRGAEEKRVKARCHTAWRRLPAAVGAPELRFDHSCTKVRVTATTSITGLLLQSHASAQSGIIDVCTVAHT